MTNACCVPDSSKSKAMSCNDCGGRSWLYCRTNALTVIKGTTPSTCEKINHHIHNSYIIHTAVPLHHSLCSRWLMIYPLRIYRLGSITKLQSLDLSNHTLKLILAILPVPGNLVDIPRRQIVYFSTFLLNPSHCSSRHCEPHILWPIH